MSKVIRSSSKRWWKSSNYKRTLHNNRSTTTTKTIGRKLKQRKRTKERTNGIIKMVSLKIIMWLSISMKRMRCLVMWARNVCTIRRNYLDGSWAASWQCAQAVRQRKLKHEPSQKQRKKNRRYLERDCLWTSADPTRNPLLAISTGSWQ